MIVMHINPIKLKGKEIATLRLYLEGTGDPKDNHSIIGVSIDRYGFGVIPEADKVETLDDINL